jgi:ureidoacrylate peracid hydrolase
MGDDKALSVSGRYWRWYPLDAPLGLAEEPLALRVDETVFLLVDVYGHDDTSPNDDPHEFYKTGPGDPVAEIIRNRIVPAKVAARRAGLRVVYVSNYLSPGLSEGNEWRNMSMRTCDVDVLEAWRPPTPILEHASIIAPAEDEPLVLKQYYSGFHETNLDSVLRGYGARNLVVVGFDSRICLGQTVTDAMYRNYRVVVLRDAIRTLEYPETREGEWANLVAIRFIEGNVGYTTTTDDFIAACDAIRADAVAG